METELIRLSDEQKQAAVDKVKADYFRGPLLPGRIIPVPEGVSPTEFWRFWHHELPLNDIT